MITNSSQFKIMTRKIPTFYAYFLLFQHHSYLIPTFFSDSYLPTILSQMLLDTLIIPYWRLIWADKMLGGDNVGRR